jgi:hypothetical protein
MIDAKHHEAMVSFRNLISDFNIKNCCLLNSLDLDFDAPGFQEKILSYIISNEFKDFLSIKKDIGSAYGFAYILPTKKLLDAEDLKDEFIDFFLDEKVVIKNTEMRTKENFSTLFFELEYLEKKIYFFKNIFSGKTIDFDFSNPHLATPYFIYGGISIK